MQKTLNSSEKTFYERIWFDTHSTANLPPLSISIFFQKAHRFVRFEKPYYFSCILRRICCNLVMKNFHHQNCRTSDTFTSDIGNWQVSVKKRSLWVDDFPLILYIWRSILTRFKLMADHPAALGNINMKGNVKLIRRAVSANFSVKAEITNRYASEKWFPFIFGQIKSYSIFLRL